MSAIDELLANNPRCADGLPERHLDVHPRRALAVVTCMDSRLDVFAALGLDDEDAHILRTAGGVITDDVIRSPAVSQRLLGTRHIMLVHHTDCGMESSRTTASGPSSRRSRVSRRRSRSSRSSTSTAGSFG